MPLWEEDCGRKTGKWEEVPRVEGGELGFTGESGGWSYWVKSVRKFVGLFALGKGYT